MDASQVALVRDSFAKVVPITDTAASLFYGRLFELDPALKPLFKGDMAAQGRLLMQMIATAVNALDRLETIVPAVESLGKRHADYGVAASHYDTVGTALLWTLGQGLGPAFTPEVKAAWTETYGILAGVMKKAAYG